MLMKFNSMSAALACVSALIFHSAWAQTLTIPAPSQDETASREGLETAIFAGGCFWGVQGVFQHVKGVTNAVSGYAGGSARTANYPTVSTGLTGHAESVSVTFDPRKVSYGQLLQVFFSVAHDPTELNKQGPDYGTQYRSALFVQNAQQERVAKAYIAQLNAGHYFSTPLVTKIEPDAHFYPAEQYHQNFLNDNPNYPYIAINDTPKVQQLKADFPTLWQTQPVLVKK